MKISLVVIQDELMDYGGQILGDSRNRKRGWYQARSYRQGMAMDGDCLHLAEGADFDEGISGCGLISRGTPGAAVLARNTVLTFPETLSLLQLAEAVQQVFLKYAKWEAALRQALQNNASFYELFEIAETVFENSMFMHDCNFIELACVNRRPEEELWEYDERWGKYYLPLEIVNNFKINPDYLKTMTTKGPKIFPDTTFNYRILYENLWNNGQYWGRICINEINRSLRPSDFELLDYFSGMVTEALSVIEMTEYKQAYSLPRFLGGFIETGQVDQMAMDTQLMQYGWTYMDTYFCACLFTNEEDDHINAIQYRCNRLMDQFPHSCVFYDGRCIVMLINSTLSEIDSLTFQTQIAVILREGLIKAGVSTPFTDLRDFPDYYRQAMAAFDTGRKRQEMFWSYRFEDYRIAYILQKALSDLPGELLCSKVIFILQEYDQTHTSELNLTLKTYLENERNLTRTSELLDVHRSTLLYRISRIEKLTGADLDQPQVRFDLLLSYALEEESVRYFKASRK